MMSGSVSDTLLLPVACWHTNPLAKSLSAAKCASAQIHWMLRQVGKTRPTTTATCGLAGKDPMREVRGGGHASVTCPLSHEDRTPAALAYTPHGPYPAAVRNPSGSRAKLSWATCCAC